MKIIVKIVYIFLSLFFLIYLSLPSLNFPNPPPYSLQSEEPADKETPLRRAYFTNFTRSQILDYYQSQFSISFLGLNLPNYRLNYPPEEAKTLIRDQTRSTFLEEIVYPLRESLFVNGFEPKEEKDTIFIGGQRWRQKIIVRHVSSTILMRLFIGFLIIILTPLVLKNFFTSLSLLKKEAKRVWNFQ